MSVPQCSNASGMLPSQGSNTFTQDHFYNQQRHVPACWCTSGLALATTSSRRNVLQNLKKCHDSRTDNKPCLVVHASVQAQALRAFFQVCGRCRPAPTTSGWWLPCSVRVVAGMLAKDFLACYIFSPLTNHKTWQ